MSKLWVWVVLVFNLVSSSIWAADRDRLERLVGKQVYLRRVTIFGIKEVGGRLSCEGGHWVVISPWPNGQYSNIERLSPLDRQLVRRASKVQIRAHLRRVAQDQALLAPILSQSAAGVAAPASPDC
jgi:hypothetical protein